MSNNDQVAALLMERLAQPFDPDEVKAKPAVVSGNRALAIFYVDARVIQDRLDDVLGSANWQDEYEFLDDGSCVCKLRLRLGGEWITKMDVGGPSEQPDEGDRRKAAVSDALKRAAVKFGIGRYLYRLPQQWADYDPQKRQFTRKPTLPPNALPPHPPRQETPTRQDPRPQVEQQQQQAEKKPAPAPAPAVEQRPEKPAPPRTGAELLAWLSLADERAVKAGVCQAGQLKDQTIEAVRSAVQVPAQVEDWPASAVGVACGTARVLYEDWRTKREAPAGGAALLVAAEEAIKAAGINWHEAVEYLGLVEGTEPRNINDQALRHLIRQCEKIAREKVSA